MPYLPCRTTEYAKLEGAHEDHHIPGPVRDLQMPLQVPSPAMLPRAHTDCSLMCMCGEDSREMKAGMAPPSTTALVCSEVPEAMLVSAQAASNCRAALSARPKNSTSLGMIPSSMI